MTERTNGSIQRQIDLFVQRYALEVLPGRTRTVTLLGRKCQPRILYTFLGFELKMGRKRITCPDMSTARYLRIFAEIGIPAIQIPYDPTQTTRILSDLEAPLKQIKELLLEEKLDKQRHQRKLRRVYGTIRKKLNEAEKSGAKQSQSPLGQ